MIEIKLSRNESFVSARFRGVATDTEFARLAAKITNLGASCTVVVCPDWIRVAHWTFVPIQTNGLTAWRSAAGMIERVAIIHEPRLNRQAAW